MECELTQLGQSCHIHIVVPTAASAKIAAAIARTVSSVLTTGRAGAGAGRGPAALGAGRAGAGAAAGAAAARGAAEGGGALLKAAAGAGIAEGPPGGSVGSLIVGA